ncbi:penicillin-binding protein 2 [Salinactinospora qingdaonensis]|uniref:Penicillin-binding protein 2 n=1 Tax=Salinactinospora qingdaonensis TaxID=702744 RepID=A0ABP7EWH9_9ACTN
MRLKVRFPEATHPRHKRPSQTGPLVAQILVVLLLAVLVARLGYLQGPRSEHYAQLAAANHTQGLVVPATRGLILDGVGRPLVRNHTQLVVSANYHKLADQPDGGAALLERVAEVIDEPAEELRKRARLCGPEVSRPCWPGSPYQPITLAEDVDPRAALQIMERKEDFPGISAQQRAVREYPYGDNAAQLLGYLQPATQQELEEREDLHTSFSGVELVGRDGLEAVYDDRLRGSSGARRFTVDSRGNVNDVLTHEPPEPGQHLVTSIDARVQQATQDALKAGIARSRDAGYPADSGAAVVMDVRTGRVVAVASLPTYDPTIWHGGIDQRTYDELLSEEAGDPLVSRVVQAQYPAASTFKVASAAAALENGTDMDGSYKCPSSVTIGDREFHNYESSAHGSISLHKAIVVSCNTVFYQFGYDMWKADGGTDPVANPKNPMQTMARGFGFGEPTGVDLPYEADGRVPGREWKRQYWEETKEGACKRADTGYPEIAEEDPERAEYLEQVAEEHCSEGYVWRAGDAANFSIGQGDVLVTPMQMVRAYAAVANGGTLWEPRVGKAFLSADGLQVERIEPVKVGELPVSDEHLDYIRAALTDVPKKGTAARAFRGFPQDEISVAGKTGSATIVGKRESAWFASYAPADDPRFAVAVFISQGGTGGAAAAPVARRVYEAIYGFGAAGDRDEDDAQAKPALPGGKPPEELPNVRPDGTIVAPEGYEK